ncbi:MAG: transglutaminase domain-containing protein [Clostridia bacterium]|nr:transglutaminase domain-containing protein [Clostridia bacterium]
MKKTLSVIAVAALAGVLFLALYRSKLPGGDSLDNYGTATWTPRVSELANEICKGAETDREKAEALYNWVISEIKYDEEFETAYQHFDADRTLDTRKGICFDISNLYAVLCRSQNIRCAVLDGYKRTDANMKHSWNRVCIDGVWFNLDLSYDTARRVKGKSLYGFHEVGSDCTAEDDDFVITRIY